MNHGMMRQKGKIIYAKIGHQQSSSGIKYRIFRFPVKIIAGFISGLKVADV